MSEEHRKCGRIICDSRELAANIWAQVGPSVPEIHELKACPKVTGTGPAARKETWKVTRLSEQLKFLKYTGESMSEVIDLTAENTPSSR